MPSVSETGGTKSSHPLAISEELDELEELEEELLGTPEEEMLELELELSDMVSLLLELLLLELLLELLLLELALPDDELLELDAGSSVAPPQPANPSISAQELA